MFSPRLLPLLSRCLFSLALCSSATLQAAEYFLAPDGNDANPGTIAEPFASFDRAQKAAAPGDTVQVRGGTYHMAEDAAAGREGIWLCVVKLDKSGREGQPITYQAYQQERPVFDFSAIQPAGYRVRAFAVSGSWLQVRSLEVIGVQVTITTHTQSECFENHGSNNLFERLSMHDGQAIGFWIGGGSNNLVLNCDAFRNYDYVSENHRGGNVDGFGGHPSRGSVNNIFRGCRAWFNSDDGFDLIGSGEAVTVENCWAFYNGFGTKFEDLGDGNGFKAGGYGTTPAERLPAVIPRHVVRGCVAVRNKVSGFYANHHPGGIDWLNNTAYRNGINFNLLGRLLDNRTDIPGVGHKLRNNLSFDGRRDLVSLPSIHFLHLAPGSALIDRGEDVGLPFQGKAPDLGAFESAPSSAQ